MEWVDGVVGQAVESQAGRGGVGQGGVGWGRGFLTGNDWKRPYTDGKQFLATASMYCLKKVEDCHKALCWGGKGHAMRCICRQHSSTGV